LHLEHTPQQTACARGLGQVFTAIDAARARRWLAYYLQRPHPDDPEAEAAYQRLQLLNQ
jgi:hypothetical protein